VELQENYQKIRDVGAELIALSADSVVEAQQTAAEMRLMYPVLSDSSRSAIRAWGVLHPQEGISRPAMFIVNKQGKIVWKYVGTEASDRPPIDAVLKQLQSAK